MLIPSTVEYDGVTYIVTSIDEYTFYECSSLTSVVISEGVKDIGDNAFAGCSSLASIVIPNGVTNIGNNAFHGCSNLSSIIIPDGVTSIGYNTFWGCINLTSVIIPDGVTSIGANAFCRCISLASISVPKGVNSIGDYTFSGCSSLSSIVIPEGVTSIGYNAFMDCSCLSSVVIPEGVLSIGDNAFKNCTSLSSLIVPESVLSIGYDAFSGCYFVKSNFVNKSEIDAEAKGVTFVDVETDEGVMIKNNIVVNARHKIENAIIPDGVVGIGESAFRDCTNLSLIVIPESVTSIGGFAFYGVKLRSVIAKCKKVPSMYGQAFSYPTYYHAPLYVRAELYDDYAFDDAWYQFHNIKKFVDNADNIESSKAYFLMNEANTRYIVYDAVNDKITTRESVADVDEENLNDNWTVVKMDDKQYLYNMGAKKFAKRDASEAGFSLVEGVADMNGAAMRKTAGVNAYANILFVENGSLSADETAKDIVSGIEMVNVDGDSNATIYNISGTEQTTLSRGINIVRSANGKVTKVLKMK